MESKPRPRAFVVHGHDRQTRNAVAALLVRLGLEPIVLELQANLGQTLLEKLERHTDVDLAVVILTPDDLGRAKSASTAQRRARQNVIFELGLLMGRIGRSRILILSYGAVEWPSDLAGLAHVQCDRDGPLAESRIMAEVQAILQQAPPPLPAPARHYETMNRSPEFIEDIGRQFRQASRITIIATGVNEPLMPMLFEAMRRALAGDCRLCICVADPDSPAVEMRLVEEEEGEIRPPLGDSGLRQRIALLLDFKRKEDAKDRLDIRLFSHYPTFGLLIFDDTYYFYPYGFERLGTFSPVMAFSRLSPQHAAIIAFFDEHVARVKRAAMEAGRLVETRSKPESNQDLVPFALFFVPAAESRLYRFGSQIVGLDLRAGVALEARFGALAGGARNYGFHLTLADVLFFQDQHTRCCLINELRLMLRKFKPFPISIQVPKAKHPARNIIALPVGDPKGGLELLHSELVHRAYRRAVASLYSLKRRPPVRDGAAEDRHHVLKIFKAPYILSAFQPHFTLLSAVPDEKMNPTALALRRDFKKKQVESELVIESVAVMALSADGAWRIEAELPLQGTGP